MARHIACQTLLNGDPLKYGWLRRQDLLHQKVKLNLLKTIKWPKVFVVVDNCFLYMYNNEQSERPSKFIHLFYATDVLTKFDTDTSECPWAFALVNQATHKGTTYIFAAASQKEMMAWVDVLQGQLKLAKDRGHKAPTDLEEDDSDDELSDDYNEIQEESTDGSSSNAPEPPKKSSGERKKSEPGQAVDAAHRKLPPVPLGGQSGLPQISKKPAISPKNSMLKSWSAVAAQLPSNDDVDGDTECMDMLNEGPPTANRPILPQRPNWPKKPSMPVPPRVAAPRPKSETEEENPYEPEPGLDVATAMWTGGAKEGHDLISHCDEDGVYLLRKSEQCQGQLTLVSHVDGMAKKFRICELAPGSNQFTLDVGKPYPRYFTGISQLIGHYMNEPLPSPGHTVCLSKPFSDLAN